jgi:hypothetical protein
MIDFLPKVTCMTCFNKLYSANAFKATIINVEKKLLSRLERSIPEPVTTSIFFNESSHSDLLEEIQPTKRKKRQRHNSNTELSTVAQLTVNNLLDYPDDEPMCQVNIDNDEDDNNEDNYEERRNCSRCNICFESPVELTNHNINVHSRRGVSAAENKNWRNKIPLFFVEKGDGLFCCGICKSENKYRKPHLVRHIETLHLKTRYYCKVEGCFYSCNRKDKYRNHIKSMHSKLPQYEIEAHLDYMRDMSPDEMKDLDVEYRKLFDGRNDKGLKIKLEQVGDG